MVNSYDDIERKSNQKEKEQDNLLGTGIFFFYQKGGRLRDFPEALKGILEQEKVFLYDAFYPLKPLSSFELEPISSELLYRVHSPEMVEEVKLTGNFEGTLFSATGTVRAAEKVCTGEINNAFIFTGFGDHRAGRNFFGGGCYFNGAAIAIQELRNRFGVKRFAIIDTDAHHGDGRYSERTRMFFIFVFVEIQIGKKITKWIYMCLIG